MTIDKKGLIEKIVYWVVFKILNLHISENRYLNLVQFVKFGFVGFFNNFICYGTYYLLLKCGVHYILSNILGFTLSVFNAYYWNNKYVFKTDGKRVWWSTFLRTYISYAGTGIVLSNILLVFWIEVCNFSDTISPLLNLLIVIPINFFINKYWAYKNG